MNDRWQVPKSDDLESIVKKTKSWSGEKTDSKTIQLLIRYGYGKLFK